MNPLNFIIDDTSLRHQRIETTTIYPRTINDNQEGGLVRFVLPNKGFLSANTCIVLPATCVEDAYQYAPNAGIYSLLKTARMSCGDQVISEIQNVGQLLAHKKLAESQEVREKMSLVKEGINFSFECGSGSKRDGDQYNKEVLQGQQRLVMDYKEVDAYDEIPGNEMAMPCVLNGKLHDSYKLKTFYADKTNEAGTPEFFIYLRDLFKNYFGAGLELPLQLINRDEEISIEIQFSDDGNRQTNERAIFCPDLQTENKTGLLNLSLADDDNNPYDADVRGKSFQVELTQTGNVAGKKAVIEIDVADDGAYEASRILSVGHDYNNEGTVVVDTKGKRLEFRPGENFNTLNDEDNFVLGQGNANYANGAATLISNTNANCNAKATLTTNAGAVTAIEFVDSPELKRFITHPGDEVTVSQTVNGVTTATLQVTCIEEVVNLQNTDNLAGVFQIGDKVENTGQTFTGFVKTVVANAPTVLLIASGVYQDGQTIRKVADQNVTVDVGEFVIDRVLMGSVALGSTGQYGFDLNANDGTIKVVTDKVTMQADIIYYEDDTVERMVKQMQNGGQQQVYTEYRNIQTTLKQNSATDYAQKEKQEHIRLIGFSNEILRNILIQNIPASDTQDNLEFPNAGLYKRNDLLGFYCSRDSLAENGVEMNVVVNSVPFYASPMNFNPQFYEELTYCHNSPLYVPHGAYCGWTSAKQQDNLDADNSKQPAFSTLDSLTEATKQYELNDRCAGICNQLYEGIGQEFMRGNLNYMGVSFMTSPAKSVVGNGVAVGSQPLEIQYTYTNTYNPMYNGNSVLNIYGEVERRLLLDAQGRISVTNASSMKM